jgi:hypothetical protein
VNAAHIDVRLRDRGEPDDVAGNIAGDLAVRAINKERARRRKMNTTKRRSRSSSDDRSSARR